MSAGLEPYAPPDSARPRDELEVAAEWGHRARRMKRVLLFPAIFLAVIAGAIGGALHVGGYWAITPVVHDRYVVWTGTVALAMGLPGTLVFAGCWVMYRGILRARRSRFLSVAAAANGIDREELSALARALE